MNKINFTKDDVNELLNLLEKLATHFEERIPPRRKNSSAENNYSEVCQIIQKLSDIGVK